MAGNRGIIAQGLGDPNTTPLTAGALPEFRFVYFEQAVAKGECQQWSDTAGLLGVGVEDSIADSMQPAGVAAQAVSGAGWGWIQTAGFCDYVLCDGDVNAPDGTDHSGDIYLVMTAAERAEGQQIADLQAADSGTLPGAFAMNLKADDAADATAVTSCILCCPYQ